MSRVLRRRQPPDTLSAARAWLRDQITTKGVTCPCCGHLAKEYKRPLTNGTARVMVAMYQHDGGREWMYLTPLRNALASSGQIADQNGTMAHLWGLMEQMPGERIDGSTRNGWWRLTDLGREFVAGTRRVPKFAHIYNGRCLRLSGPPWSIRDALGTKFNYDDLMS